MDEVKSDPKWNLVISFEEEMIALMNNNTWNIVTTVEGVQLIGSKWVYMIKYKSYGTGTIERYKAHFVVKGFGRKYEIHYLKTFVPMTKINIIRLILALVL